MNEVKVQRLVDAQAEVRRRTEQSALGAVIRLMRGMSRSWYDERLSWTFARDVSTIVDGAQAKVGSVTAEFLDTVLAEMEAGPSRKRFQSVKNARGVEPQVEWRRPAEQFRYARSQGATEANAQQAAETRAKTLVTDDITFAMRKAAQDRLSQASRVIGYRRVIHPEESAGGTCGLCAVASDRRYHVDDLMPVHANCVSGDAVIGASGVAAITRRRNTGPMVLLQTASGHQVRVTPNHPVLTDDGWVPAGLVDVGDHVIRYRRGHRVVPSSPGEQQASATAEDLWRAATMGLGLEPRRVPLAAKDFHGDGFDGEVDVVATHGLFSHVGDVTLGQPISQPGFVDGGGRGVLLSALRSGFDSGVGLLGASHRSVSGVHHGLPLCGAHLAVAQGDGLAGAAQLESLLEDATLHDVASYTKVLRDGQHGRAGFVPAHDRLVVNAQPDASRFDPAFAQFAGDGRHAYAALGGDLRERLAGEVESDRVVDKCWIKGPDHVYNLQSAEGWYAADGVIVSNCHCAVLPITRANDPGSSINDADIARLYGGAGSTAANDLKRVRYVVTEHSELGPQLVAA